MNWLCIGLYILWGVLQAEGEALLFRMDTWSYMKLSDLHSLCGSTHRWTDAKTISIALFCCMISQTDSEPVIYQKEKTDAIMSLWYLLRCPTNFQLFQPEFSWMRNSGTKFHYCKITEVIIVKKDKWWLQREQASPITRIFWLHWFSHKHEHIHSITPFSHLPSQFLIK